MTKGEFIKAIGKPTPENPTKIGGLEIVGFVPHARSGKILLDIIDESRPGLHYKRIDLDEAYASLSKSHTKEPWEMTQKE